jgi:hypothetical protein
MYNCSGRTLSGICFIALTLLASCTKKLAPQNGLVGEYLLNKNAVDQSKLKNDGVVHGATPAVGHKGKKNTAYHFNGIDQYITIPHADHNNFEHDQDFTISLWVSLEDQADPAGTINDIMRKWRGDTQGYPFAICYNNDQTREEYRHTFSFVRYDGSICRDSPQAYTPVPRKNDFIHLVCIKKGPKLQMYMDNKLVAEANDTTKPSSDCGSKNNCEVTIGTRGNRVRFFTGTIDDVRFYNRALTEKEIGLLNKL